ncbi:metacaspase-1-like [Abeliophyllum distichum]|uniref:Metacaspase-1-like n=1 Tax=Abeliophyllum distichum TaxID=126358 RepID=A0ABD1R967_9LAMI
MTGFGNDRQTYPAFLGTSKHSSQDQDKIIKKAKGIRHFFGRRCSGNNSLHTAFPSTNPHNCVSICGRPPRGKRAFLCGVSYKKQKFKLKGAINEGSSTFAGAYWWSSLMNNI